MNLKLEFSKVKASFMKVKKDIIILGGRITHNYDEFMRKHESLAQKVDNISDFLKLHSSKLTAISNMQKSDEVMKEVKELKSEMTSFHKDHKQMLQVIEGLKNNKKDMTKLKKKVLGGELETYLLKEKLLDQQREINMMKEINKNMFKIIVELSNTEVALLKQHKQSKKKIVNKPKLKKKKKK